MTKCSQCSLEGHNKRTCKMLASGIESKAVLKLEDTVKLNDDEGSKNSRVAKSGTQAEKNMCSNPEVKRLLEGYFKKEIKTISEIPGRKKSDNLVTFIDGSTAKLQLKTGIGNGRGWSVDRRPLVKLSLNDEGKTLVGNVCLKQGPERPVAMKSDNLIDTLLCGDEKDTIPTHFVHSIFDKDNILKRLDIGDANDVITLLKEESYAELLPKRTCVHLSPHLYLQRKGGGSKDHRPDHIQLKLRSFPSVALVSLL